MAYFQHVCFY